MEDRQFYAVYLPSGEAMAADLSLCSPEDAKKFDSPSDCHQWINDNYECVVDMNGEPLFDVELICLSFVA